MYEYTHMHNKSVCMYALENINCLTKVSFGKSMNSLNLSM